MLCGIMSGLKEIKIIVKWSGKEYEIGDLTEQDTVALLKHEICKRTNVQPNRQKLLNLKYKGKFASDDIRLSALEIKPNFKLMMVGSIEADIEEVCTVPEEEDVIDDFETSNPFEEQSYDKQEVYLSKVSKRIRDYKIEMRNQPREGKKLLVLDIDYTLFDHRSTAEQGTELMRPFLHEFLTSAHQNYDIVIWSATGMRWIEEKMRLLGVSTNENYKILFYLDSGAMISIYTGDHGVIDVKPLGVIWGKFKQYSAKNTIMFDDIRRNFLMNPRSGLRIRPFRQAHVNRSTDRELLKLAVYLKDIAEHCEDFTKLDHRKWEHYKP
ncbi:ubiquitin-like domain-containing CTD phosphatase 1 [Phlebotomus argentipes]|uniref:ubiquitin-like domain-containing CTD phosphatase 1 n=1 Tax=Phlebotomus argentipes TaxID=94469 RepID=UPI002893549E|nr:ubiquitin-like domain-containing CTD phosphatase 1 [Phlebotomus argentipes]